MKKTLLVALLVLVSLSFSLFGAGGEGDRKRPDCILRLLFGQCDTAVQQIGYSHRSPETGECQGRI